MSKLNRRSFLTKSALAAATASWTARSWSQVSGANDLIRVAVVGFHGRGESHIKGFGGVPGVKVAALCDVDTKVLSKGVERLSKDGGSVEGYVDMRKLFEQKHIDVISIATPNHWHSLAAIWAIQAGKDVYVEKPVSHNVWEGRQVVNAARKYKKMCQAGTQSRSSIDGIGKMVEWVKAGNLGKILVARGQCYKPRESIGKVTEIPPIPDSIDFDLWCGPAEVQPIMRAKFHYDWHWFWNTGCGDLGNQGIHQMDIARWFLGEPALSPRVWSVGGRKGYIDDGETPNTQIVYHDYAKAPLIFEVRGLPRNKDLHMKAWGTKEMDKYPAQNGGSVCVNIHCEGGMIHVPGYNNTIAYDKDGKKIVEFKEAGDEGNHFGNLIKAVRSRKVEDLHADILQGHLSSALCHTGNISYRLGHLAKPGEIMEEIKGDRDASTSFARMVDHLKANGVDLETDKLTVGPVLKMNPATERFIGNKAADRFLTRNYRKPFVVPTNV